MKKPKKSKLRMLRFRKGDYEHNIHAAVQHWVHANGGTAIVTGGIEIQWSHPLEAHKYKVALGVVGKPPEKH